MSEHIAPLPALFAKTAATCGGHTAINFNGQTTDFTTFDKRSDAVAANLQALGIVKGDRIGLYCINSDFFAVAYFGIVKAGATVVPINLLLNPKEVAYILNDSGARALIYFEAFTPAVNAIRADLPAIEFAVCIGAEKSDPADRDWPELLCAAEAPVPVEFDVLPMFHAFAATVGMLFPLLHGCTFAPVPKFEPNLVADTIAATGATVFMAVPSMYNVLLRLPETADSKLDSLRLCLSGGAAMPVEILKQFEERYGKLIYEGDGPTECSPVTCVNPIGGRRVIGSVGTVVPDVEMTILDDHANELPHGQIGEICVRGPNVMKGYWQRPEETAEAFFDEWFRTGDLGTEDDDGYFHIVDRMKDMIIVNGMNVYPRVVEEILYQHEAVGEAAVIGEPSGLHGEIPVAYIALTAEDAATAADLRGFCREHLGNHEVPRKVFFLPELPKNAAGKIVKRELRKAGELERGVDSRESPGA